ncbi:MAG: NAD(P)/FAD-dependent oxidoreductase [Planctomycetes bacterium]|nr:NAD(P)/FAD-dependent oxidoreductase [Planctomycetota bacterium]
MSGSQHYKVVIVGGGAAGISTAARLQKRLAKGDVAIVDPSQKHYYQPLWTLVGGGVGTREATMRDEASVIPPGAVWIQEAARSFSPTDNAVELASGGRLTYDALVVCPGIQLDWHKVEGLEGNIGKHGICSNYSYETVAATWPAIQQVADGKALFTHPNTPIKCGGAPQKIMYLAESTFRRRGVRDRVEVHFYSGMGESFTVPHYARKLDELMARRKITPHYQRNLVAVRAEERVAVFEQLDRPGEREEVPYSMIHVTPPMSAPDFIKQSPLANAAGWIDVDKATLQHARYPNVFGLGDASSLPTSKTGAAIRKQAPTAAANVLACLRGEPLPARYAGYTSCPIVTDYGKLILAEFDYDKNLCETFPFDQSKERLSMYLLKKHALPKLYWHGMLKGRA